MNQIILGLDISTTCTGVSIVQYDGESIKVLYVNKIKFKIPKNVKGTEGLFLKARQFRDCFINQLNKPEISEIVIEQPLLRSNNVNTIGTLLQFNGILSQIIYDSTGIVPTYISSYEARKYAFPELMAVRKFNKKGEQYSENKIRKAIKDNDLVLFGEYAWDCDKKHILWNYVSTLFPYIEWDYDKNGKLRTENFDASDSLICILGQLNREKFQEDTPHISDCEEKEIILDDKKMIKFTYHVDFCGKHLEKSLTL